MAETQPAAAAPSPSVTAAAPTGDWVVNLASYTYESMAIKKLAVFQAKGVNGEIEHTTVNGKSLYRIRVTGFESSRAARASIPDLQKTLGLKGVWIARR
jgi:cell division septation protein DedD